MKIQFSSTYQKGLYQKDILDNTGELKYLVICKGVLIIPWCFRLDKIETITAKKLSILCRIDLR